MNLKKTVVHFTDPYLLSPPNPILVNLIGAGGTGSQVLSALARINHALVAMQHPGLFVRCFDDDVVKEANLGRQLFAPSECGQPKSSALIARINRFFGINWKSICTRFDENTVPPELLSSNITISCVDTAASRFTIAKTLRRLPIHQRHRDRCLYWMDFGNALQSGQVILSTVHPIKQPVSKQFTTIATLPPLTEEYKTLLQSAKEEDLPSCSLADALSKQDLFINSSLAALGASLLWNLFRQGLIRHRGFFVNLENFRSQPVLITPQKQKQHEKTPVYADGN